APPANPELPNKQRRLGGGRGIVDRQRGRQLPPPPRRQPVAKLNRHQRIQAKLLQRHIRTHRRRPRQRQHRRNVLLHQLNQRLQPLPLARQRRQSRPTSLRGRDPPR